MIYSIDDVLAAATWRLSAKNLAAITPIENKVLATMKVDFILQ